MNNKDSEDFFSNIDIRRKKNDLDCNNRSYTGKLINLKNVQSNTITPLESQKISRANSRHSANPNHDYDLIRNRSNPNYIVDRDNDNKQAKFLDSRKNSSINLNNNENGINGINNEFHFDKSSLKKTNNEVGKS